MPNKKPFFSVVLPTLNRAHYLPLAIKSVLSQEFDDFELIVSDNCSSDNTEEVVRAVEDPRIRYVKTEKTFPMWKSWRFAFNHAIGEYITFLGDDDAHSPIYLSSLAKIIFERQAELVACKMCTYYYFDVVESGRKITGNTLFLKRFTGNLYQYETASVLERCFEQAGLAKSKLNKPCEMPLLINAAYQRSLIEKFERVSGKSFMPEILCNDQYTAVAALTCTNRYFYLDSPLALHGFSKGSTTQFTDAEELKRFFLKFSADRNITHSPLKFITFNTMLTEAFLQAKADLGDSLDFIDLDWRNYYLKCYRDLLTLSVIGIDVSEQMKDFFSVVKYKNKELARELNSLTNKLKIKITQTIRKKNRHSKFANLVKTIQNRSDILIRGSQAGFKDIAECARTINENFLGQYKQRG